MGFRLASVCCLVGLLLNSLQISANYIPKEGDIIFHRSNSNLSAAIQIVTKSPYSHMGMVFFQDDKVFVFEAVNPVKFTPLDKWIKRGANQQYVVKRLKDPLSAKEITKLKKAAKSYIGKPYDIHFEWSDEKIYCSELVWKVYHDALDLDLAKLNVIGDYDLTHPIVAKTLKKIYKDRPISLTEKVIAPVTLFESPLLTNVNVE